LYQTLLSDSSLYTILLKLDEDLAAEVRERGCTCGGCLHSARYRRKARGVPCELDEAYSTRYSFCCAEEGCRRRMTPPSFRFLGRKVFAGAVVVLVTMLRHGATPSRMAQLRELVGVSYRTVKRWRDWWGCVFVKSSFWRGARGLLRVPVDEQLLPLSLLGAFSAKEGRTKLVQLLRFILPVTTSCWCRHSENRL